MTLENRIESAFELRAKGYNCAQCVVCAFPDIIELPQLKALQLSCGLGGGVGGMQQTCGVVSAMAMLEGNLFPGEPTDKAAVYKSVRLLAEEFAATTPCGSTICATLKGESGIPCNQLIKSGIEIFHRHLENR